MEQVFQVLTGQPIVEQIDSVATEIGIHVPEAVCPTAADSFAFTSRWSSSFLFVVTPVHGGGRHGRIHHRAVNEI